MTTPIGITLSLDGVQQTEAGLRRVAGSMDGVSISAKQTAAALRGVPAQFTDIITSLQGGQAPLTVFLQQGGQLKDMFGGAGNAARALGGYVLSLVNPFTLTAAAAAGIAVAYNQGAKEAEVFGRTLILTGNAAGASAESLSDMARAIDATRIGITQSKAAEVLNTIAASGDVAADKMQRYAQTAIEFERSGGGAAEEVAKQFAGLAADPLAAVEKLNKSTNFLTAEIYNQIKALDEEGRSTDAARMAQEAYADALDQRIPKLNDNLGLLERGWRGIKGAAAEAWDAMLNVGRAETMGASLKAAEQQLADYEKAETRVYMAASGRSGEWKSQTERLRSQIAGMRELLESQRKSEEQQRASNQSTNAAIDLSKQASRYDSDLEKQQKAVAQATEQYTMALAAGNLSAKARTQLENDYLKTVSGITAVKEKRTHSTRKENKDLADQSRIFAELADVSSTYYKELAAAQTQHAKGNISDAQYIAYVEELIQKQPFAVALAKKEAAANNEISKAYAAAAAERVKFVRSMEQSAAAIAAQNDTMREEIELIGLTSEQQARVLQQRNEAIILTKEATLAELERTSAISGTMTREQIALAAEIEALKERNSLLGARQDKTAMAEATKKVQDEWTKTTDQINQSLTDALMRGFESGKDFAKNMRDTVVNMFKTMVLRPVISAVLAPVAGGLAGAANASAGGSSLIGTAGSAASVFNAGSALGGIGAFGGALSSGFGMAMSGGMGLALEGGAAMLGSATGVSSALAGIGQIAGALGPIALGIGAIALLAKSFDNSGTPHMGAGAIYSGGTIQEGASVFNRASVGFGIAEEWAAGTQAGVSAVAKGLGTALDGIAKTFGEKAGYEIATAFADDSSKDGAFGSLRISREGKDLINWDETRQSKWAPKSFADGEEGYKQYLAAIAKDTRQVLLDMDLPSWADTILASVGDTASMEQLSAAVQQIGAVQQAFAQLGATMDVFAGMTDTTFEALMKASGGLEALAANANAYYAAYYSETERLAQSHKAIERALRGVNAEMPRTKDELRLMVEALDLNTEAGRATYATLMQVAPAFAEVADAASRMAQETATQLLATYSGNGRLAPLLDTTLARFDALGDGLGNATAAALNMGNAAGWINTNLMVASSGLLFFGDRVQGLDAPLSGAQLASAALSDQILALRLNASRSTTDIAGLSNALANVNTETFMATMQGVLQRLADMFSGVLGDISNERISVREAAMQIINPSVMSKSQIQRAIAESNVGMPGNAGMVAAQDALGTAYAGLESAKQGQAYWGNAASAAHAAYTAAQNSLSTLGQWFSGVQKSFRDFEAYRDWAWSGAGTYSESMALIQENQRRTAQYQADAASYNSQYAGLSGTAASSYDAYLQAQGNLQAHNAAASAYQSQVAGAEAASKAAQIAYIDSLQNYAIDASKATSKLGKLREETVKYYESQKALADLMATSASTLRQTVADYRYSQLTPEQQFRSLEGQFNTAYSMALSTSGETLASYADKMSGLLGPMLDKMAEAGYGGDQSTIAAYLARAEAVAGRVDSLTPTNYAADSLAMLGQIDSTLAALEAGSKSAERIIADAINVGRDQTVNGLRQVVNALTGKGVAAFAAGGMHTGGLRLVGENGPELEVTGPARIYNASQTRAMLGGGGGSNTDLLAELRALRAEVRALRAEAQATAGHTAKTARHLDRMDADGLLVRTDADTPLATVPA